MNSMGNDLVREARRRAGLTQAELADRAGTTQSAIARIESGASNPTFEKVLRLIRICDLDLRVNLVPRDDSAWVLAQELLPLTPGERIRRSVEFGRRLTAMQARVRADGAA